MRTERLAALVLAALLAACTLKDKLPLAEPSLQLTRVSFAALPGWGSDDQGQALGALARSCDRLASLPDERTMGIAGQVADWRPMCTALAAGPADGRVFFEHWFRPYAAADGKKRKGLYTGYYEASLNGSLTRSERYATPLHRRPGELVMVNLGDFRKELVGERIAGQVVDGRLKPYADRAAIAAGALNARDLEIVWVDDPVDAFFLHIQGSGRIALDDGRMLRVGYAAQNGHPYTAVGRLLIARGEVTREAMSMQTIRAWLDANPTGAQALMNENASYVFFDVLDGDGPVGAQGAMLTAGRSLAVDRRFVPLSTPVWLDTTTPDGAPLQSLMIAQDTGGAIRGPVRGDVYWGHGDAAADIAGRMKSAGHAYLLLPRGLDVESARR
ncbi:MAG: murein transglycosylase A [Alphaproteobacteria bacterium]|nr:murein transglycosylase A [Alphaproteobacteria bacterium]MDP7173409.1 murein transglycosylase A [Alphaproteobacteria bacterium]MDP7233298.1 murein transglycosylase A [Alphaproteobacteria bacterium]MDP7486936.1 murein transglycosylase A [Alphaproteobacteria bacterium]